MAVVGCVFLLGSCARGELATSDVELPFSERAVSSWSASAAPGGHITGTWPTEFGDPKLVAFIDEALRSSPTLKAASARLAEAEAVARMAGAELYPQLSANLRAARAQQVFDSGSSPFLPPGATGPIQSRSSQWGVSLDLSWEVDLWGRIRSGVKAAEWDAQSAMAAHEGARLSLASQVARAYLAAVSARVQARIAGESLTQAESLAERVRTRFERGLVTAVDHRLTEAAVESSRARVAQARRLEDAALRQLEILVGRYPNAESEIADALPANPAATPAGLPMDLLTRRPDTAEAWFRWAATLERADEARATRLPRIALTGSAGTASGEAKNLLNGNYGAWSLAANLASPVFDAGRLANNQTAAEARTAQAAQSWVGRVLAALAEVETSLASDTHLALEAESHGRAAAASREALDLSQRRYDEGLSDILTVLRARQDTYAAQGLEVAARTERLLGRISLFTALGGGFEVQVPEDGMPGHRMKAGGDE
jgi:NodT family efflux transporter outer membrane factor (OMF) lipoprotein